MTIEPAMVSSDGGTTPRLQLAWKYLARAVRVKTFYLATIILAAGVALIGVSFAVTGAGGTLLLALGSTLATSSIFSVITEAMLRLDVLEDVRSELSTVREQIHKISSDNGMLGVQLIENRRLFDFAAFIRQARGELLVTGFSANDILAVPNCDHVYQAIRENRVQSLHILLLDPQSDAANTRGSQPAYRFAHSIQDKIGAVTHELQDLALRLRQSGHADVLTWGFISEPITISIVADDRLMVATPIVRTKTGGTSPTLVLSRNGAGHQFYDTYREHFTSLAAQFLDSEK